MSPFEYNIIAALAAVFSIVVIFTRNKQDRSILGFFILYGIGFLVILFIFWIAKLLLG